MVPLASSGGRRNSPSSFQTPPQAFSDYQIQQMTANFVDQFGFNDEEFSEHDENIKLVETHKKSQTRPTIAIATIVFYDECLVTLSRVPCGHGKPGKSLRICILPLFRHGKVVEFCKITESFMKRHEI